MLTIHETDLFRPHNDPDDHFDLACQFALQKMGLHKLAGIMIDMPPAAQRGKGRNPDLSSVAQLNLLTGGCVPVGIGAPDSHPEALSGGSALLRETLLASREKVNVHIVGSSRDIAVALRQDPDLFREKCAGIYLNAGSGIENGFLEWNVCLDPRSYHDIFSAPCPVYWCPCFERANERHGGQWIVSQYGTFYSFTMGEILRDLSPAMQNFFLSMLNRETASNWLDVLDRPVDPALLEHFCAMPRNMWSTAGILSGVGKSVDRNGNLTEAGDPNAVFGFSPVRIECSLDGHVTWQADPASDRYLFSVLDLEHYATAMARAMKTLLMNL